MFSDANSITVNANSIALNGITTNLAVVTTAAAPVGTAPVAGTASSNITSPTALLHLNKLSPNRSLNRNHSDSDLKMYQQQYISSNMISGIHLFLKAVNVYIQATLGIIELIGEFCYENVYYVKLMTNKPILFLSNNLYAFVV